jgi:predicted flap endonuclease-1-like 5' DNA nuclease
MEATLILGLLALLAGITIVGIWWGAILKRRRIAGDKQFIANREAAEQGSPGSTTPASVAPAEPPLADEPIPAAAPFDASPAALAADPPPAPVATAFGDITQLKGLGPKLAATLAELGFTGIDQIAALTPEDAAALDARLGAFQGRMARDRWIEQATLLSAGDKAGYEAAFGKLGG